MSETYSIDQLKTWGNCQKKYEYKFIRRLDWPSNPKNFRLGKGVHQLLDYEANGLPLTSILANADPDIVSAWQFLSQSEWAKLPVITSEWGFSLEVEKRWIYGRIDRIVKEGQKIHILDWKTGTSIPRSAETDWQTRIYLLAVYMAQEKLGLSCQYEDLIFTYVQIRNGALKVVQVPYTEAMHLETKTHLLSIYEAVENVTQYQLPATCPDRYCPYSSICGIQHLPEEAASYAGV